MTEAFLALCTRRLSREATSEESRQLDELLQDPEHRAYFEELEENWNALRESDATPVDLAAAHARYLQKISAEPAPTAVVRFPSRRGLRWVSLAAAACLAFGAWLWFPSASRHEEPAISWITKTAPSGQRLHLELNDGTTVTLDAGSKLSYRETFDSVERTVRLEGKAFFSVAHDARHPFVVETAGLRTRVLGTKFNVRAFGGEETSVALVEGSVAVQPVAKNHPDGLTLSPGQQFSWDQTTEQARVTPFDQGAVLDWLSGRLTFQDERLGDIVHELERRFGVNIELSPPVIAEKRMSFKFEKEELPQILDVVAFAAGLRYELVRANGAVTGVRILPAL